MLRVVGHKSAAAARQYYTEGLKREDYYSEGQEVVGEWHGKAARRLGLKGDVTPEAFAALVDNRHPGTGQKLTPRTDADRIVGYDINFHAPKSLSVLYGLTGDDGVLKAFRSAVAETMRDLEERANTRVRKGGAAENRTTGNLAWAEFIHLTARPVDGVPDPHLHIHCFTFNATFDEAEGRFKAAKFRQIKEDAPYAEAAFHARLTAALAALGYGILRTPAGWELKGVPQTVIDKFSRRAAQIERTAQEKGISDPKKKDALAAATREGKRHGLSYPDLLGTWGARLTDEEKAALSKVRYERGEKTDRPKITAAEALDHAADKLFAKNSVVEQRRLAAEALRFGVGHLTPDQVWRELAKREMVVAERKEKILCTTVEVLNGEIALIRAVRSGRGMKAPIQPKPVDLTGSPLSGEQRAAVGHILKSHDQVIAIRGAAGVGKTTAMREAVKQIEASGLRFFAFAPSASASRETLREAGFEGADTVARFLQDRNLQKAARGQVIWIDEAGLLSVRQLSDLLKAAGPDTRIILTGDSGQHGPVERGDAFHLIQKYSGLRVVGITEVRRQQDAVYKQAVEALSRGDIPEAFGRLDDLGAIVEVANDRSRYRLLAQDYLEGAKRGGAPLVVAPTHAESAKATEAIRDAMREAGLIKGERVLARFHNLQWEEADKKRSENYAAGHLVQFHQNAKGIRRGQIFRVLGSDDSGVKVSGADGRELSLPLSQSDRFQVFERREITVGKGDAIRITRNGESADGKRLSNGNVLTVDKFDRQGRLILSNGAKLNPDHGHFTHGYCQTSHSSQSKSVKEVLVAQSESSFVASSREQFYVSVSRGKERIRIYTDSREGLQRAVGNSSIRQSALEFAGIKGKDLRQMREDGKPVQWRSLVQSRMAHGEKDHNRKSLLAARRQDPGKKPDNFSWRKYVEMRRGLVGQDGKSRSKGSPDLSKKKGGRLSLNKRSFLRPTELTAKTTERLKAAHEAKKTSGPQTPQPKPDPQKPRGPKGPGSNLKDQLRRAYQSAGDNFRKFTAKIRNHASGSEKRNASLDNTLKKEGGQAQKHEAAKQQRQLKDGTAPEQAPQQAQRTPLRQSNAGQAAEHAMRQKAEQASKAPAQAAKVVQQVKQQQPSAPAPIPPVPAPRK